MIEASDLWRFRVFRTELGAGPFFLSEIAGRKKKNLSIGAGGLISFGFGGGSNQQRRTRLGQAGEIEEIIVLAKTVQVIRAFALHGCEENHHRSRASGKRLAAGAIVGVRLALERETRCHRGEKEKAARETRHGESSLQLSHRIIHPRSRVFPYKSAPARTCDLTPRLGTACCELRRLTPLPRTGPAATTSVLCTNIRPRRAEGMGS